MTRDTCRSCAFCAVVPVQAGEPHGGVCRAEPPRVGMGWPDVRPATDWCGRYRWRWAGLCVAPVAGVALGLVLIVLVKLAW